MRICIVDYDAGNIGSVKYALSQINYPATISSNPNEIAAADKLILPGVGSFFVAMETLHTRDLVKALQHAVLEKQIPILGICLGMQLFATTGFEGGITSGLNFIEGSVNKISTQQMTLRLPHVGWNTLSIKKNSRLLEHINPGTDFYFLHSFQFNSTIQDSVVADAHYGQAITAIIEQDNVYGVQFHPEKSGKVGLQLLKNFLSL